MIETKKEPIDSNRELPEQPRGQNVAFSAGGATSFQPTSAPLGATPSGADDDDDVLISSGDEYETGLGDEAQSLAPLLPKKEIQQDGYQETVSGFNGGESSSSGMILKIKTIVMICFGCEC